MPPSASSGPAAMATRPLPNGRSTIQGSPVSSRASTAAPLAGLSTWYSKRSVPASGGPSPCPSGASAGPMKVARIGCADRLAAIGFSPGRADPGR